MYIGTNYFIPTRWVNDQPGNVLVVCLTETLKLSKTLKLQPDLITVII